MTANSASLEIRQRLGHPVVDADGHFIETAPVFKRFLVDFVKDLGGSDWMARFERVGGMDYDDMVLRPWSRMSEAERRDAWVTRPPWWSLPTQTLDRATAHLPRLMYERLDDLGIDFAVLYPSRGLTTAAIRDEEVRRLACRATNAYHAEIYAEYADRMTPVALIPTHSPAEAIEELEYAVETLGFKAVLINGIVHRPVGSSGSNGSNGSSGENSGARPNWGSGSAERLDTLGIDSAYDYDPFWARCVELRVAPASHTPGQGWGSRRSISSYMYNHIGSFAASMEAFCKSLFLGGVTRRFPELSFGLLEGGVGWACLLYADLIGHWEKRNAVAIRDLDPARLDTRRLLELFKQYGDPRFAAELGGLAESFTQLEPEPPILDEWAACGIETVDDIRELFVPRFYFGCEADDPSVAWAFDDRVNPMGARLRAMFSSDIGHWDVPDMTQVLAEAYEPVENGVIGEDDFRDFVFANPVRFYTSANPDFFRGTRCESEAAKVVGEEG